jgi:hypothetical protein
LVAVHDSYEPKQGKTQVTHILGTKMEVLVE